MSRFVQHVTWKLPDSMLYKGFRNKRIKVNGKRGAPDTRLAANDVVALYLNDEFFKPSSHTPLADGGPLPAYGTVYQDKNLAVLYKPAGVLSHPDAKGVPTLLDAFTSALVQHGEYTPAAENTFAPALCNRLDQGTEGLVIGAKHAVALRDMNAIIRLGLLQKIYLCVCCGTPPQGLFSAFLLRDKQTKTVLIASTQMAGAKPISTGIQVLEQWEGLSLCRVVLHTGRTHQIRAHLAFLGAPLLGDTKYGSPGANARYHLQTQLLCALRLCFAKELPGNSLAYLGGQCFEAADATLPAWWAAHKAGAGPL